MEHPAPSSQPNKLALFKYQSLNHDTQQFRILKVEFNHDVEAYPVRCYLIYADLASLPPYKGIIMATTKASHCANAIVKRYRTPGDQQSLFDRS
jgi:hypothetical protein